MKEARAEKPTDNTAQKGQLNINLNLFSVQYVVNGEVVQYINQIRAILSVVFHLFR